MRYRTQLYPLCYNQGNTMAHIRLRLRVPGDAGNKGAEGQAAVVHSILNRWVSGRYGSTPTQVVPAPGQYERVYGPTGIVVYRPAQPGLSESRTNCRCRY